MFQLIRGGQDISLQIKPTLGVLNLLENKGLLPQKTVSELTEAYVFLRNCEHRLMYVDDAQTHELPKTSEAKARIAKSMHFADWTAFLTQLNVHRKNTQQHFDATFKVDGQAENINETAIWQGLIETESALQALSTARFSDADRKSVV